ncbi:aromatic ring-hydroxylating dioxygenase subunit alpha [Novosphingobium aerophilum]|uniref:aromatic ring-hydroxylating dioxygenase subunit alpha n=1 Tax=Novosphingobium aerophilum TaxID=2839843 RepID=UPI001BE4D2C4|nr:aromatic ring-hydroxylating dioxygenase subunit alpha [Novosphingobium aerophilum]
MVGWSGDLDGFDSFRRTILDVDLLVFRGPDGAATALRNRCPHRFAPLHMGRIENGVVTCGYHGLRFAENGRCVHNPHGDGKIPASGQVEAFAVAERHGLLWVWLGERSTADLAALPDFSCLDDATHHVGRGYLRATAHYTLETDNIMDLSHIDYLHPGTLASGGGGTVSSEVKQDGTTIWSNRLTEGELLSPFLSRVFAVADGQPVDRWLNVRWNPPASMLLEVGVVESGQPREGARGRRLAHIFSPESETSTHYWFAVSYDRSIGPQGAEIARKAVSDIERPFLAEDLPMIEAVQAAMNGEDFWTLKPMILPGDAGAVRARRLLDKLIRDEEKAASADN